MGPFWIEAFRYHKWANLTLLDTCAGLSDEKWQLTTPGTYGTIAATFQHIVSAEDGYLARLIGRERRLARDMPFQGPARLKELVTRNADEFTELAARTTSEDSIEAPFQDGLYRVASGIVLIQALHHGNDHRTHICTILGAHGIQYPEMDVWGYGDASGDIVMIGTST